MREGIRNKSHLCKGFFSMGGVMEGQREERERIVGWVARVNSSGMRGKEGEDTK